MPSGNAGLTTRISTTIKPINAPKIHLPVLVIEAETGSVALVTNEGNGDLTQTLPRVHIVLASIEKLVPTLEDATTILRVLARSATGQDFSNYTTFSTGPRRPGDPDGPEVLRRLKALPGFGEQKAKIFLALLGKQYGVTPRNWRAAAGDYGKAGTHMSIADVVDKGSLEQVRAYKKKIKAAAKAKA